MGINWRRVVIGGLVAGVVIIILDFFYKGKEVYHLHLVMGERLISAAEKLGLTVSTKGLEEDISWSTEPSFPQVTFAGIWTLFQGIPCVWVYAAIRPRFGAGVKTAIIAGLAVWFFLILNTVVGLGLLGIFPTFLLVGAGIWTLVELLVATAVGARFYKEAEKAGASELRTPPTSRST